MNITINTSNSINWGVQMEKNEENRCVSCGRLVVDYAEIPCPECKETVIRCNICRQNRNEYTCKCGFVGP